MTTIEISAQEYEAFHRYLEDSSGIVLGDNKHYLVTSRLKRVMQEFQLEDITHLVNTLKTGGHPRLHEQVVDAMTTNETLWFRDSYPFEILRHQLLPEVAGSGGSPLRIWSAASSSGQEAYSISMTIEEYLGSQPGALPASTEIIGTDISATMLRDAEEAVYDNVSLRHGISEERQKRFFLPQGDRWQLRSETRARTRFRRLNLLDDFTALGEFDIIFCRNVLIYFSSERKSDILNRMAQCLKPGGYLFLGGSESPASYTDAFELVRTPRGVVYRIKG